MPYDHKEYTKSHRAKNGAAYREAQRRYACSEKGKACEARKRQKHKAKIAARNQRYRDRHKEQAFEAYGGYICACCGETEKGFLTLDHINSDGHKHRREVKTSMYRWIVANDFPPMFQVLCMNCNWGRHRNGGVCPHKTSV